MAESLTASVWAYRGLYAGLAVALLFLRMLPLGSVAGAWPGPDLLVCLTFAWVLRRPDYVPVLLIAVVLLVEDLLVMRPPGLWTAIIVLATEFLRQRGALAREISFAVEWLIVAAVMAASLLAFRLALMLTLLPEASPGQAMIQLIASILCYPVVVGASRLIFGVRKPATGEVDAYGRRL
ncbi:MAG: rod shape-determining protein MreD [Rhodobacter sp.]|nr:rod shape-determining protein MreD [Rhodobacter sp.]MCA3513802.1 rod shape-determining protein MreD [Rhodobacter sp.]MCA3519932.1 rod shape-determining protein MreD [Rhodobacter sp.]MCA3522138.1 rod shape-determining protein MreD [Rhodobacter sp.]MCA3524819.1 rod shape-determining protein MreD [Rhodobacter sp.]